MSKRLIVLLSCVLVSTLSVPSLGDGSQGSVESASVATITEFPLPTGGSPDGITAGPDGNLWFTEFSAGKIGRITTTGAITEFSNSPSSPAGIVAGPDGNLWFTDHLGAWVRRITTAGVITDVNIPTVLPSVGGHSDITVGPDGNLWFTERERNGQGKIGVITTAGAITEFPISLGSSDPRGIAAGSDGNIWFTEWFTGDPGGSGNVWRMTTNGEITGGFTIPTAYSLPEGITAGPDGNLWFTEAGGNKVGRITTTGDITEFPIPTPNSSPFDIAAGPDGNLWFTEQTGNKIGRITTAGVITEFLIPTTDSDPLGIAAGPDGNIWFTVGNKIGRLSLAGCSVSCSATVPATAQAGTAVPFQATVTPINCVASPTFEWDFGDGSAHSSQQNPSHPYGSPGSYTWTVTATADGVSCQKTGTIIVGAPATPLLLSSVELKHHPYPDPITWTKIEDGKTTDGNLIQIEASVKNDASVGQKATVLFVDADNPDPPLLAQQVDVAAEGVEVVRYDPIHTTGYAWRNQAPREPRTLKVILRQDGAPESSLTKTLTVIPRPLILVHGFGVDSQTWDEYKSFLPKIHGDWKGFAVDLREGSFFVSALPTNTIRQNAEMLAGVIEEKRHLWNAWHVDILAHSMGGLISRQYIQDLMPASPDSNPVVRRLLMLGTPNLGTPCALQFLVAIPWPVGGELTPIYVQSKFNVRVNDPQGVLFSVLAGDLRPYTCFLPERGDSVVTVASAHDGYLDPLTLRVKHFSLPGVIGMTTSGDVFEQFVLPRLSREPGAGASSDANFTLKAAWAEEKAANAFQLLEAGVGEVASEGAIDLPLSVPEGTAFSVSMMAPPTVTSTLKNPAGDTADSIAAGSDESTQLFRSFRIEPFASGSWLLRLENTSKQAATVPWATSIEGNPVSLTLEVGTPGVMGALSVTGTFLNGGAPVAGATVTATFNGSEGVRGPVSLLDDGQHGDGAAGDGGYGGTVEGLAGGIHGVTVRADASGISRIARGVGIVDGVESVTPTAGPAAGAIGMTVRGRRFQPGASVAIGGSAAVDIVVVNGSEIRATAPALPPGSLNDVTVTNPDASSSTLAKAWFSDFSDVPQNYLYHGAIEKIFRAGITTGCGNGEYCPGDPVNRASMSTFILRGEHGPAFQPPPATGAVFSDVSTSTFLAKWIEAFSREGITTGCGNNNYCPTEPVNRASMSVFLLRAKHGASHQPSAATGTVFGDVTTSTFLAKWIEQFAAEGITSGCGNGNYCPNNPVTRGEMAVFLRKTFRL